MATTVDLIRGIRAGDRSEFDRLFASLYDELRRVARGHLRHRSPGQTLDTGALIHEAYLRMVDQSQAEWADRAHFFAYASRAMRAVLVDYARRQNAGKRGGGLAPVTFDEAIDGATAGVRELLDLDAALDELARIHPRQAAMVESRFFGGLDVAETAELLDVSEATILRDWRAARAWLAVRLRRGR